MSRPSPVYNATVVRPWRLLDRDLYRQQLMSSQRCNSESWLRYDVDSFAHLYDTKLEAVLDRLVPKCSVTCRRRPSHPWFDQECREAKRRVCRLERISSRTSRVTTVPVAKAAAAAWSAERRAYRDLLQRKREAFWGTKIDAKRSAPRRLWQSIDALMGRGHVPLSTSVDARQLHRYFDDKVADFRASTADTSPPSFTTAPPGCVLSTFQTLDIEDVAAAIHKLPDKQCTSDPVMD